LLTTHQYPLVTGRLRLRLNSDGVLACRHNTQLPSARDDIADGEPLEFQRTGQVPVMPLVERPRRRRVFDQVAQRAGILAPVEVIDASDAAASQPPLPPL